MLTTALKNILGISICFFISCTSSKKVAKAPEIIYSESDSLNAKNEPEIKAVTLKKKYAEYLDVDPEEIKNIKLYRFIDEWLNTPYLMGGNSKQGIDCSAFVQRLYNNVYQVNVPRTSVTQFFHNNVEPFGGKQYLTEGDLVFFKTIKGTTVSHVGFYLANNYFVHASSSYGVSIAKLDSPYWKSKYVASGRIKQKNN